MTTIQKEKSWHYPIAFWFCACSEIFERLSYYLGRSLILLFVTASIATGGLGLSDEVGANMQANLTAFSYLGSIFGAIVVDRWIGAKFTTPVGMAITGIGYYVGSLAHGTFQIAIMIFLVSVGLGLFKNGPILGRIITNPEHMDSAFSLRYMLVNLGALIGTVGVGILYKDVFASNGVLGFRPCFKIAAIVMWIGTVYYATVCWKALGKIGTVPFKKTKTKEEVAMAKKEHLAEKHPFTLIEKKRIGAIIIAAIFSIIFWIFWYLAYLPVYYYWNDNMNWTVGGYEVPITWFDGLNSLFCVVLAPTMAMLWNKLAARPQGDISLFRKTGIGIGVLGLSYVYFLFIDIFRGDSKPSVLLLVIFAFLLTLGEMFFSPLGSSFISKYSPSRIFGLMMSVWGISVFIAAKSYGYAYGFLFKGNFTFVQGCTIVAVIAFVVAILLFVLDKKLSALVKDDVSQEEIDEAEAVN